MILSQQLISITSTFVYIFPLTSKSTGLRNLQSLHLQNVRVDDVSTLLQSLGSLPSLKRLDLSENDFSEIVIGTQGNSAIAPLNFH